MGQGTVKLRYFKDLTCASSPDLFTLFSSVHKLETNWEQTEMILNLQEKEA